MYFRRSLNTDDWFEILLKMKKIILFCALGFMVATGCKKTKHEIIPAPVETVDLNAEFSGDINGAPVYLKQGVQGYFLDANKTKVILPAPQPSAAIYYADMKSGQTLVSVKVNLGSVLFDAATSSDQNPTLQQLNDFINANLTPTYSTGGAAGFEVVYRDANGAIWTSDAAAGPQDVEFTSIVQESDATGDYFKFICTFNTTVYRTVGPDTFSLPIQNAVLKGWFKR